MSMENQNMDNKPGTATDQQQEKTFTQEQVNAIVGKRLAEQKQQLESEFVKREQELNRREMSIRAKELLAEKGLSKDLAEVLRYDTEDDLVKAIETIEHTRGFKNEEQAGAEGLPKGFHVIGTKLGHGTDYETTDPIASAFKREVD